MERLRSKDTRQVLKFLRDLYALREKNAFTSHLVSSLPPLIRADAYTYNEMDQAHDQASYKLWPSDFTPVKDAQEILGRFASQIPMHAHWKRGDGQALKISDFLSPHAHSLYDGHRVTRQSSLSRHYRISPRPQRFYRARAYGLEYDPTTRLPSLCKRAGCDAHADGARQAQSRG